MPTAFRDIRLALRMLRKSPAFTVTTVLILALAIGANTAMFSILDAWLLRPLHFKDSDQLVIALRRDLKQPGELPIFAFYRDYLDWKRVSQSFQGMSAMFWRDFTITGAGDAGNFMGMIVSADICDTLGSTPQLGRAFAPSDLTGEPVVMINHQLWQERFSGATNVIGRTVTLNSKPYRVIGVLPQGFSLRMENQGFDPKVLELMQPGVAEFAPTSLRPVAVVARLKPNVTMSTAQAELFAIRRAQDAQHPDIPKNFGVFLTRLQNDNVRFIRTSLITLVAAIVSVLLIACANVAGLLMGRGAQRAREMALRAALGSGRARLMKQLLTESLVLALMGAGLGLLIAYGGVHAFMAVNPFQQLPPDPITINGRVLAVAVGLAILNALLFGTIPAFQSSKVDLSTYLKTRGTSARVGSGRNVLVILEVALSLILLTGTALLTKTLIRLMSAPLGFQAEHVEVASLTLPGDRYASHHDRLMAFYDQVLQRVRALPGVRHASLTTVGPLLGGQRISLAVAGRPETPDTEALRFEQAVITPQHFAVLSTPLLQGRDFTDLDTETSLPVAIVNEAVARTEFLAGDSVGKQIRLNKEGPWRTIVGVTGTIRTIFYDTMVAKEPLQIFVPARQTTKAGFNPVGQSVTLQVLTDRPVTLAELRTQISAIDANIPVGEIRTMERVISDATRQPRVRTAMLGGFAILAMLLSAIGIYGLIAQSTAQRTNEIGIRMALGAQAGDVLWMVIRQGISIAALGTALGILGAVVLVRTLSAFLYGIKATDVATYMTVSAIVVAIAALAAWIPARKAARVDPLAALRYE